MPLPNAPSPPAPAARPGPLAAALRRRSLTLTLLFLFLCAWTGQYAAGLHRYNDERARRGFPPVSAVAYLASPHFWQATAENWESEFLQMAAFVFLTTFLYQKGSPESRDPDQPHHETDADPAEHRNDPHAPWPVRHGGLAAAIYSRSLSTALLILFFASISLHLWQGLRLQNEERARDHLPAESLLDYATSADFWFESFQNWQSEFLSIAVMVYLAVYLRQRGSPESKPVHLPYNAHE